MEEYKGKLKVGGDVIPDPVALKTDWVSEENGISKWASIFYKLGKAYHYFADNFVREI